MAVGVRSHALGSHAASTTFTCNKPAGLQVGDLMIAHCSCRGAPTSITMPSATGSWNTILSEQQQGTTMRMEVAWRIADANDVAASSYSFSTTTSTGNIAAITAFTGFNSSNPINASSARANTADASLTNDTTALNPSVAGTLLCQFHSLADNTAVTSNYRCLTNNPSPWTAQYAVAGTDLYHSMAHGQYAPSGSSTSDIMATIATNDQGVCLAICIAPDPSGAPAVNSNFFMFM